MESYHSREAAFPPKPRAGRALLCLVVLVLGQLCFVQGWPAPIKNKTLSSKIQRFMREKPRDKDVKKITSQIRDSPTAGDLLDYVDTLVDKPSFNYIHVAAAYTKLGNLRKKKPLDPNEVQGSVLVRLQRRLQGMLARKQVGTQALANILWAFANLFSDVPAVLKIVPDLAEQIPRKVGDMFPQHLSNSLWAIAQLQHVEPKVLEMVPVLVKQIPLKAGDMKPQELANTLEAFIFLQEYLPVVNHSSIVAASVEQRHWKVSGLRLQGDDLRFAVPAVVWACGKSGVYDPKLFAEVAERFSSKEVVKLPRWGLCALPLGLQMDRLNAHESQVNDIGSK